MQLRITHRTAYRYDEPVKYSAQALRLTPRREGRQRVLGWSMQAPGRRIEQVDAHGNVTHLLTVEDPHKEIEIVVTGGNFIGEKLWGTDNGSWVQEGDVAYGHATAANPGYKAEIAGSVGPLLYVLSVYNYGGWSDYISKSTMNKVTGVADGLPPGGFSYSIKVDGTGRVSKMTPTGVPAGTAEIDYNYY